MQLHPCCLLHNPRGKHLGSSMFAGISIICERNWKTVTVHVKECCSCTVCPKWRPTVGTAPMTVVWKEWRPLWASCHRASYHWEEYFTNLDRGRDRILSNHHLHLREGTGIVYSQWTWAQQFSQNGLRIHDLGLCWDGNFSKVNIINNMV